MSLSRIGLNNNFYALVRCWCGRATLTLLSAVMLSDSSMKFPPKCTCLREQPAPQPSKPLAGSHPCSTDRQVQAAFCIPSLFHVNFFYPSKYHLHIPFVKENLNYKEKTWNAIHILPRCTKRIGKDQRVLSVYIGGEWSTAFPLCRSSSEVESVTQSYIHISYAGWKIPAYSPLIREKPFDHMRKINIYTILDIVALDT